MSRLKEQLAWDNIKPDMAGRFIFKRIENQIGEATPDVIARNNSGSTFWLELKALDSWPKRRTTLPLKNAFEPGQVPFLRQWIGSERLGLAFVLLRVAGIYYLLNPKLDIREMTSEEIVDTAICSGKINVLAYLEQL